MRITFVSPAPDLSGGQRVIAAHASRLARRGHTVTVFAPPHRTPSVREVVRGALRGHWPRRVLNGSHYEHLGVEVRQIDHPRPVAAGDLPDADVVVATWWETAEWVAKLPPNKGAKVYFIQGYEVSDYVPSGSLDATWRLPMSKIVVAQWLEELAITKSAGARLLVVPNAVSLEQFNAPLRRKKSTPTVGLVYSLARCKGCDLALEAFRIAARRVPNLKLRSFGSEVARTLPLPRSSSHTTRPPQHLIREIYAACDAWLFASRSEGFGLPILEAMACRTPVIGAPAGAAPELLAGGGGVLVEPEDPTNMAEAIVKVCTMSEVEWRVMSDAAYATATKYTWDDATDLFEAALVTAANGTWPPAKANAP